MDQTQQELLKEQLEGARFAEIGIENIDGKQVFVATDETVDREGEVISIDGWDLADYKRNPILLWSHNPFEPMIGRATNIRMRSIDGKKKMTFEPEFHEKSDLSKLIAELVREGWMKTVSVGFRPFQKQGNRYTKQQMLEISFVNIPANPEATQLALSKGYNMETVGKLFGDEPAVIEEETKAPDDMAGMKKRMDSMESRMDDMESSMSEMREMMKSQKSLTDEIKDLQVALEAKAVSEPVKTANGRSDKDAKQLRIKRLIQLANKALDHASHDLKGF